jgi:ribosomal subunit interface protein
MSLRISGKQMEIGDAFRVRIEERIGEALNKYFDRGFSGNITVEKSGSGFDADCTIRLDSGVTLQASASAMEPISAFESAADRIEKRLRRYKRRLKSHNAETHAYNETEASYRIMTGTDEGDEEVPEDFAPAIVAESTLALRPMSVAEAVMELDLKDSPVFVFRNAGNGQVNIVYRRADKNIGWIDPSNTRNGG